MAKKSKKQLGLDSSKLIFIGIAIVVLIVIGFLMLEYLYV